MSTSGCFERASAHTQSAASTPDRTSRPIVFAEPQPQVGASLTATSSAISQPESKSRAEPVHVARARGSSTRG